MALKTKTKILDMSPSKYILIPYIIHTDSKFPFKDTDRLEIEADKNKIVVKKAKR